MKAGRGALLLALVLVACTDGPTGPSIREPDPAEPAVPAPAPEASAYDIVIRYVADVTPRQRLAVDRAVAGWRAAIRGDLSPVPANAPAGTCFAGQPAVNETVDDLLLFVEFSPIDGAGQVLGEAGPCYVRSGSGLPVIGQLRLDSDDLARMEQAGTLDDVVMHEMGHVLGFGTLWPRWSLLVGSGGDDPYFSGAFAIGEYRKLGGAEVGVPVENTGGTGTRNGHWRESLFGNELMTGYISGASNPLSAMTVASLRDLGYDASTAGAEAYQLGSSLHRLMAEPLELGRGERMMRPRYEVDALGRRAQVPEERRIR